MPISKALARSADNVREIAHIICNAPRYQHSPDRLDSRAGSYKRKLLTTSGEVELTVPRLRRLPFETQIIQRYQTKQSSVEEALIEMYLAGVSVRRVEDSVEETLSYMDFPYEHWEKIRTNNGWERIMKEIRRRTRVVGSFPDGYSAMMLVGARLRHISTTKNSSVSLHLQNLRTGCNLMEIPGSAFTKRPAPPELLGRSFCYGCA